MKQSMLLLSWLIVSGWAIAQSFSGDWRGTLTRDYGHEVITDSIEFHLEQQGDKITGYSILYVEPGVYIRSLVSGSFQKANKTLRLTETKMEFTNMPDRGEEIFLDRYLLYFDKDTSVLTGKSVAYEPKAIYTRSKMLLKKKQ